MSYLRQSGAKERKQFQSNYAKHSSLCNRIKPGNSSLQDLCKMGAGINAGIGPDCSLNGPDRLVDLASFIHLGV